MCVEYRLVEAEAPHQAGAVPTLFDMVSSRLEAALEVCACDGVAIGEQYPRRPAFA